MDLLRTTFPKRLKWIRESRGITQEVLADMAHIRVSSISNYETAHRRPSVDNLERLADALDTTMGFLWRGKP